MALTTDTYWDINGVPLQTMAYNITTWGGDLQAPPPLRGQDLVIPYRVGEVLQVRRPSGRSMTFNMWVTGADQDGNVPSDATMRETFEANFSKLRALFWNQGKPLTLTKRWKQYGSSTVISAKAQAIYVGGLAPSMQGNLRASFSVEIYLPDPFFYGNDVTLPFPSGSTNTTITPTILGDYETTNMKITFNASRNNMRLTNASEGIYVNVNENLSGTDKIVLDVDKWTCQRVSGTLGFNKIGQVTNFGHEFWMVLRPGLQELRLSSGTGTASGSIVYKPRWL